MSNLVMMTSPWSVLPPRPDVFLYQPLYICILVHTNTWSLLAQTCALIFQPPHPALLRRKTLLPAGSCIIITFPMIDFLITTISVQFRAFSIDWHVYKMRMNQKVNQMTNSLFTLIHHRPAAPGGPIYFFWQKNWRDWRGGTDSADVLVFVKIIIEIYDFIALNGLLFPLSERMI